MSAVGPSPEAVTAPRGGTRAGHWLREHGTPFLWLGALTLALVAALLVPGNPLLDLGERRHRTLGTVLAHSGALLLLLGCWGRAPGWLALLAARRPATLVGGALGASAAVLLGLAGLAALVPGYTRHFLREWGLVEPLGAVSFLAAAWVAWRIAALRRARGAEHRPYRLAAVAGWLMFLDEVDYLGVVGGPLGRVGGVYVGSLHDLLNLASHYPAAWAGLALLGGAAVAGCWRTGYLTGSFLRAEVGDPTTVPVYLAGLLLALSQAMDVDKTLLSSRVLPLGFSFEEPLELLAGLALILGFVLKYRREWRDLDAQPRRPDGRMTSVRPRSSGG